MIIKEIKNGVAVEISDVNIKNFSDADYQHIKDLLFKYLIVVIKKQDTCPASYTKFVNKIGPIKEFDELMWTQYGDWVGSPETFPDPDTFENPALYPVQRVTGKKDNGKFTGIFATGILDWHSDMNRLDIGDGTALQAYKVDQTSTCFLNTAKAVEEMPQELLNDLQSAYCEYTFSPDVWAKGIPEHQRKVMLNSPAGKRKHYKMWLFQYNAGGTLGMYYFPNNGCLLRTKNGIDYSIKKRLDEHLFQEKYMYEHWWEEGDIVLNDQLLSIHKRGQNDAKILENRILHRICFRLSNIDNYVENNNKIDIINPALTAPSITATSDMSNEFIFGFDYNFDRNLLLKEFQKLTGNLTEFTDNGLPGKISKLKILENFHFDYIDQLNSLFNIKSEAKFYVVKSGEDFDLHVDYLPLCSINILLSGNPAPVYIGGKNYFYKNCVLNVQKPHGVFNNTEDRILFKLSIFDYSFEEVKEKVRNVIQNSRIS